MSITWGLDGAGKRHYLCSYCEIEIGLLDDKSDAIHECDTHRPKYHNRGIKCETSTSNNRSTTSLQKAALSSKSQRENAQRLLALDIAVADAKVTTRNTACALANLAVAVRRL